MPFRGAYVLWQVVRLATLTLWLRLTMRLTPAEYARHVREFLQRLGTVWITLGRTLSMRSDLVSAEFASELVKLHERGDGFPFATARQIIERELNVPLERYFEEFAETPFSAMSSFQLHRARLRREQIWVAVKVLRPYAEETARQDLALIRRLTWWLGRLGIYPRMRWGDLHREVEETALRELDLRFEAASLRQFRRTLPAHGVYVPDVYSAYSTRRVLVMEFIHGALMADHIEMSRKDPQRLATWMDENNVQPRRVAQRLFHSVWRQIFEDNFFHADLHPHNVILLRDNRLAIVDCRCAGMLEADNLAKHRRFIEALSRREFTAAAEHGLLLVARLPMVDLSEVRAQFIRVWRRWENRNYVQELPSYEKSFTSMLDQLNRIMYRNKFEVQWSMARFGWTLVNADTSILHLTSEMNYLQWLRQYFRAAARRSNRIGLDELADGAVLTVSTLAQLPHSVVANSVAQQELLRRQARVFRSSTTKSGYFLATLYAIAGAALMLVGALFALAFLDQHYEVALGPVLGGQLLSAVRAMPALNYWMWILLLSLTVVMARRVSRARDRYLQNDVIPRPEARAPV
jgi:ubiquinone biosynthesis protein